MVHENARVVLIDGWGISMINGYVHSVTTKLKTANINFAPIFAKPPNKIPANISGYTVCQNELQYKPVLEKFGGIFPHSLDKSFCPL